MVCGLFDWSKYVHVFIVYLYIYWRSSYQEGRVEIPLTGLTPHTFGACPKPGLGFQTSYIMVFLCSVSWSVRFVDIGAFVDHHWLKFFYIIILLCVLRLRLRLHIWKNVFYCSSSFFKLLSSIYISSYVLKKCSTVSVSVLQMATCRWFSLGTPVSSINKTDCHDITEILFKVALNTIKQTSKWYIQIMYVKRSSVQSLSVYILQKPPPSKSNITV
jgi:hypothetical protein